MPPNPIDQAQPAGAPHAQPRWHVRLLGRVQADGPAMSIARWHSRAVAELLARLALAPGRMHPREELAELLWPGAPGSASRARLRQALSILRSQIEAGDDAGEPVLLADRQNIWLAPHALSTDAAAFEALVRAGRHQEARALYAGELMPGHYSDWVLLERERLNDLHAANEQRLDPTPPPADAAPSAGTDLTAAPTPTPAPEPQPPDRVAASRHTPTAQTPRQVDLPSYWTPAFGNETACDAVLDALAHGRLVNIVGAGGMGKTRLGVQAMARLVERATGAASAEHEADALVFVPLAKVTDANGLWHALAERLPVQGQGAARERVLQRYRRLRAVLLLDNVEQLLPEAVVEIEVLLRASPGLRLIATSRRRLGLDGEQVVDLGGLALPPTGPDADLATLSRSPAVQLFVDRARASRADFHLTAHNRDSVRDLVHLLDGMPLAIELAASRVRALQPRELLERLRTGLGSPMLDLLSRPGGAQSGGLRHASMRSVVGWSWAHLSAPAQRLLRGLSVLQAPCNLATLEALWPATGEPQADSRSGGPALAATGASQQATIEVADLWVTALAEAVDTSMLEVMPPSEDRTGAALAETRYRMLQPVHEFASEQCDPAMTQAVRARLRHWLWQRCAEHLPRRLDALRGDLVHGRSLLCPWDAQGDATVATALMLAMRSAFYTCVPIDAPFLAAYDAIVTAEERRLQGCEAAPPQDQEQLVRGLNVLAQLQLDQGLHDAAAQVLARTEHWACSDRSRAVSQAVRGLLQIRQGRDLSECKASLEQAYQRALDAQDPGSIANTGRSLALVLVNGYEDYERAERLVHEARRCLSEIGDAWGVRGRSVDLAACWGWIGREAEARALLRACIDECAASPTPGVLGTALWQLGRLSLNTRQWEEALATFHRFARFCLDGGMRFLLASGLAHLGEAWVMAGRVEDGARMLGFGEADLQRFRANNRIQAREIRRARRWLVHRLGAQPARLLWSEGAEMSEDEAMALLDVHLQAGIETGSPIAASDAPR